MKTLCTLFLVAIFFWSTPLAAKYCKTNESGRISSCTFRITPLPDNSQIVISYTQQGWSLMAVIFREDWVMLEGDARMQAGKGEVHKIEHINTRRDITPEGLVMEAAIYRVNEAMLHEFADTGRKIRFWLPASEAKEQQLKIVAAKFSEIEAYITETKIALGLGAE